jgi:hypothetical protein
MLAPSLPKLGATQLPLLPKMISMMTIIITSIYHPKTSLLVVELVALVDSVTVRKLNGLVQVIL